MPALRTALVSSMLLVRLESGGRPRHLKWRGTTVVLIRAVSLEGSPLEAHMGESWLTSTVGVQERILVVSAELESLCLA